MTNRRALLRICTFHMVLVLININLLSCEEDEPVDRIQGALVNTLNNELLPLTANPIDWTNDQLNFLDPLSSVSIVGVGEATHGTAEFFQAKHRIFRYLAENHGFKIFAIEADFGESIFMNEAIQNSDKSQIERLMKDKMHFWTWKTEEVRDLLYWMCDYNQNKPASEKLQYWGVDCQFNTFHPDMVLSNLERVNIPFMSLVESVTTETKSASKDRYADYSKESFDDLIVRIENLKDSLTKYKNEIVEAESESFYKLTFQLVELIQQVSEVMYYSDVWEYREKYMAKNTRWVYDYFHNQKVVLWAHNGHVSNNQWRKSMGYFLKADFLDSYSIIGFLFSKGSFTAVTQNGSQFSGLKPHSLEDPPKAGSINNIMSDTGLPALVIKISDLQRHIEWRQAFQRGVEYFHIGATYNDKPQNYYLYLHSNHYDRIIYFDRTTFAKQLRQ